MIERRDFLKLMAAAGVAPIMAPAEARDYLAKVTGSPAESIIDVETVIVDGAKLTIDLEQVESWIYRRELFDRSPWWSDDRTLTEHVDTIDIILSPPKAAPDFYRWFMSELRGLGDLRLICESEGIDVIASAVEVHLRNETPNIRGQIQLLALVKPDHQFTESRPCPT